jgi:hypothetical protein
VSLEELIADVDATAHAATAGQADPAAAVAHIAQVLDLYRADRYQRDTADEIQPLPAHVEGWSCTGRRAA